MRSSQSIAFSALVVLALLPALVPRAHAGPTLDAWIDRTRAVDAGGVDASSLLPWSPTPGIRIGWGASQSGAWPGLVANEFIGRGGVRVRTGDLVAQGRLRARIGVVWRAEGSSRALSFDGTSLGWAPGDAPDARDDSNSREVRSARDARGEGEFYASVERRHWGPGWVGSLILDGAAPAVPAVGWRRTTITRSASPWLSWIGPWGADVFVGRLAGHREPRRPAFIGMRVQLEPAPGFDVGLSRTLQWGGHGRDEGWSSLRNALLGNDNVGYDGITVENEPGNQLAGIDARWRFDRASTTTSAYAQVVGEDEAGHFTSRNMLLAGLDTRVPLEGGSLRLFAEVSDTLAGRLTGNSRPAVAYRHSTYRQGYTHEGVVIGHASGGDVRLGSVGAVVDRGPLGAVIVVSTGRAEPTAQLFAPGRVTGANAGLRWTTDAHGSQVGARWIGWRDTAQTRHALQLWWQAPLW